MRVYLRIVERGYTKILLGLSLQMSMNVMETIGASMAARTSWEATGVVAPKGIFSITSGISVSVSTLLLHDVSLSHLKVSLSKMNR